MNTQLKIGVFTLAVTGFYTYVSLIVPQMEAHPPKSTEIADDLGPAELAMAGRQIFFGKGTCALCHTIGGKGERCPDLAGIGSRAATRKAEISAQEYLAQSLYQPNAYVVDGYAPTMPQANRPPIGLEAREIAAVVAFLQSQGGEVTVTANSHFEGAAAAPPPAPAASEGGGPLDVATIIQNYGCTACHDLETPARRIGPSLYDLGTRQDKAAILQALLEPDAVLAKGDPPYPPGLMLATLTATGFYERLSLGELNALTEHLAALRGGSR